MKKTIGISLTAILMAVPLMSFAEIPVYPLANPSANDGSVAATGYVKGAYNSIMNVVNTIPPAVVETVNHAKVNGDINVDLSTVRVTGTTNIGLDGAAVTGDVTNEVTPGYVVIEVPTAMIGRIATVPEWDEDKANGTATVTVQTSEAETVVANVTGMEINSTFASTGVSGISVGTLELGLDGNGTAHLSDLPVSVDDYYMPVEESDDENESEEDEVQEPEIQG